MRYLLPAFLVAFLGTGCMSPSAIKHTATRIGARVTPAARGLVVGSRRLVHAAGQAADDATLATQIKTLMLTRKGGPGRVVTVRVNDSVVTLTGSVANPEQRRLAAQLAGETTGVQRVDNRLKVRGIH